MDRRCSLGLPWTPLLWLQDCERLAVGASHSHQNVYEALDSKQLTEAHALIGRRRDGDHLALSSHQRRRYAVAARLIYRCQTGCVPRRSDRPYLLTHTIISAPRSLP